MKIILAGLLVAAAAVVGLMLTRPEPERSRRTVATAEPASDETPPVDAPSTAASRPIVAGPLARPGLDSAGAAIVVHVVDSRDGAAIPRASVSRVVDPVAPFERSATPIVGDEDGYARLGEAGCYGFEAPGFASRCVPIKRRSDDQAVEVRLSPAGAASVRLVTTDGDAMPGIRVRAAPHWPIVDDEDGRRPAAADLGRVMESTTDGQGVARFEGLALGDADLVVFAADYLRDSREPARIPVSGEPGPPVEIKMRPLFVGAVLVDAPHGPPIEVDPAELPEGWHHTYPFSGEGPVDGFPGQRGRIEGRMREALGHGDQRVDRRVRCIEATPAPGAAISAPAAHVGVRCEGNIAGLVDVPLVRPSAWTAAVAARLAVPVESLPPLTEVRVRFQQGASGKPARCPAVLTGGRGYAVLFSDQPGAASVFVPRGSYELKPELHSTWDETLTETFDPLPVLVGATPVDVAVKLERPVAIVALDVRDEFGRKVSRFNLHTRTWISIGGGCRTLAVDDDAWDVGILPGGGYEEIPLHKEPLQRGRVNPLKYTLRRKE